MSCCITLQKISLFKKKGMKKKVFLKKKRKGGGLESLKEFLKSRGKKSKSRGKKILKKFILNLCVTNIG